MKEFIDSVKALGEKMTGKEVEGAGLVDVVDDIAEKYEGGGQGGGSGSPYVLAIQDLRDMAIGAHLDVEATISLIQELDLDTTLITQWEQIGFCMSNDGEWRSRVYSQPFAFRYYDCASEYEINVFGMMFGVGNENNLITALRSKKADIESYIVENISDEEMPFVGVLLINNEGEMLGCLPVEKLRSIFVKDNA